MFGRGIRWRRAKFRYVEASIRLEIFETKDCAPGWRRVLRPLAFSVILFGVAISALAQDSGKKPTKPSDLAALDLEDLMNLRVTSVSKESQKMSQVAAAVFVIGQEDIRRSGSRNIPDLLRMVPGLDVAQINANTWAISVRGFNSQFANKLFVLVD